MDVERALLVVGGVAPAAVLRRAVSRHELRTALAAGRIVRVGWGAYSLPDVDEHRSAAARVGGALTLLSAARHWQLPVKVPPREPQVLVPRGRNVEEERRVGIDLRFGKVNQAELRAGVTTFVHTVVECARWLEPDEALAVLDSALRSRKITRDELRRAVDASPRTRRSRARRLVELADGRAANPFESVLRAIALEVPGFSAEPQGPVPGVGHADVADVRLRIALEAESWEFHGLREAFDYDIRRYTAMVRRGWLVVRFTWDDVMHKPDHVREVIADLVAIRTRAAGALA